MSDIKIIQSAFMQFNRRAEGLSQDILTRTFVDAEPLFIQLSSKNHQILYGRRGTGKTHAIKVLMETITRKKGIPIYIDLRVVGSNGAIYADPTRPLPERATRLLIDVLEALESELIQIAVRIIDTSPDPNQITLRVDDLSAAIRAVEVKGAVEIEELREVNKSSGAAGSIGAKLGGAPEATLGLSLHDESSGRNTFKSKANVAPRTSVDFGTLQAALAGLLIVLDFSPSVDTDR